MRIPRRSDALDPELDARLVARCLNGEARAWEALIRRHERLVYAVARSWRLSEEDLGDAFQEVFAALVRALPRLRDARTLVRWLSVTTDRIARTIALRRRREQALHAADPLVLENRPDGGPAVGAELEQIEGQALVRLAMAALSPRCQRLLSALYYEDPAPAYSQLAKRLGVPVGSLGPTRARCMEKLREHLEAAAAGITEGAERTSPAVTGKRSRDVRRSASPPVFISRAEELR